MAKFYQIYLQNENDLRFKSLRYAVQIAQRACCCEANTCGWALSRNKRLRPNRCQVRDFATRRSPLVECLE